MLNNLVFIYLDRHSRPRNIDMSIIEDASIPGDEEGVEPSPADTLNCSEAERSTLGAVSVDNCSRGGSEADEPSTEDEDFLKYLHTQEYSDNLFVKLEMFDLKVNQNNESKLLTSCRMNSVMVLLPGNTLLLECITSQQTPGQAHALDWDWLVFDCLITTFRREVSS